MSSDETSIDSETKPSVQTVVGTSRQVASGVLMEGVLPGARLIDGAYRAVMRLGLRQLNMSTAAGREWSKRIGLSPRAGRGQNGERRDRAGPTLPRSGTSRS